MIYLDNHATTQVDAKVCDVIDDEMRNCFANPHSASHALGWRANDVVENARNLVAKSVGAKATQVIFTSGATEANNIIIKGISLQSADNAKARRKILVSSIEHPCIMQSAKYMESHNIDVGYIPVLSTGRVDLKALENMLDETVVLVSVMLVNNEIGTIQDITAISKMVKAVGAVMHSDIAQALGRVPVDMKKMGLDAVSISSHKIYGAKGIGALVVSRDVSISPLFSGGGQEKGLRSGTLSPPLCAGFGVACDLAVNGLHLEQKRIVTLRDSLQNMLVSKIAGVRILGDVNNRISGGLSIFVPNIDGEDFFSKLKGVAISSGSACSSAKSGGSSVLRAIGMEALQQGIVLRICIGRFNTTEDIEASGKAIIDAVLD